MFARCSHLILLLAFVTLISTGVAVADSIMLSGVSLVGDWREGLFFTSAAFGPVNVEPGVYTAPVLVGYVTANPSAWSLGEEDFWSVGVQFTVNGIPQLPSTLFDSEPEVLCLTPSCSDATPDDWAIDSYFAPGSIYTSSGEIVASTTGQGVFEGGDMLIPASNGAQVYPLYYSFSLISEPSSATLLLAGIVSLATIFLRRPRCAPVQK